MTSDNIVNQEEFKIMANPVYTWKCWCFGGKGICWSVEVPPNFFWRWMQFLILGNRWEKIK